MSFSPAYFRPLEGGGRRPETNTSRKYSTLLNSTILYYTTIVYIEVVCKIDCYNPKKGAKELNKTQDMTHTNPDTNHKTYSKAGEK